MGGAAYFYFMTRIVKLVVGVVILLAGVVFTLQGLDIMGGSSMSGKSLWVVLGAIIAIAGAYLLYVTLRAPSARDSR
jgi:hypothetical protein